MLYQFIKFCRRLKTFLKSLIWHISLGLPKSSYKTILYRYDICSRCDSFDSAYDQCLECGCNINTKKQFMNKLAWADQECPLGKWKRVVE